MSYAEERCPTCGCVPNWHLVWRREVVRRVELARAEGQPEPAEDMTMWRMIYRHEANRPCRYLNDAWGFAPHSLAPADAIFTREGQDRIRRGLPLEPAFERGDAWEGEAA